jgi:hypothetical protein
VQAVALDRHRHVVGIEPHRHVEREVGGHLVAAAAKLTRSPIEN